jgi:hypothetical protein
MRKLALLSVLVAGALATAGAVAGAGGGSKRLPINGTVWAVERFESSGHQDTLAAFDAATGDVLGVVDDRTAPDRRHRTARHRQGVHGRRAQAISSACSRRPTSRS